MASHSTSPFSRGRLIPTLTTIQHVSAMTFSTFLVVHLAAPAVAVVAKEGRALDLASKTMILGRVYYQSALTEPIIVYGAAVVHLLAGAAKRMVSQKRQAERVAAQSQAEGYSIEGSLDGGEGQDVSTKSSWWSQLRAQWPAVSTWTGFLLTPTIVLHVLVNRIIPAKEAAPIHGLSPSELDYGYVAHGFQAPSSTPAGARSWWPIITVTMYALLLGAGSMHVVWGVDKIAQRSRLQRQAKRRQGAASALTPEGDTSSARASMRQVDAKRRRQRKVVVSSAVSLAGTAWLTVALRRMLAEPTGISGVMAKRVEACYRSVWPYSWLR